MAARNAGRRFPKPFVAGSSPAGGTQQPQGIFRFWAVGAAGWEMVSTAYVPRSRELEGVGLDVPANLLNLCPQGSPFAGGDGAPDQNMGGTSGLAKK